MNETMKNNIETICSNRFEAGLSDEEFNKQLEIVYNWICCEWQIGHIEMYEIEKYKGHAYRMAEKYRNW